MSEQSPTPTSAEAQLLQAFRDGDYGTIGALIAQRANGQTTQPVPPPKGYLDALWEEGLHVDDIDLWQKPLDVIVAYVFSMLVSGLHIEPGAMYEHDNAKALLKDIRLGVIMGIRETGISQWVQLKKLFPPIPLDEAAAQPEGK